MPAPIHSLPVPQSTQLQSRATPLHNTSSIRSTGHVQDTKAPQNNPIDGTSFSERLSEFVQGVDEQLRTTEQMTNDFADGKQNNIHGTMLSIQKADVSLRLLANVRNKVIEAYREVMRMGA